MSQRPLRSLVERVAQQVVDIAAHRSVDRPGRRRVLGGKPIEDCTNFSFGIDLVAGDLVEFGLGIATSYVFASSASWKREL